MFDLPLRLVRPVRQPLRLAPLGLMLLWLGGCEAPLDLEAVQQQRLQPIQRTDFYQSMASNDQLTLLAGNHGVVLISSDLGQHWQRQQLPTDMGLIDLDVCPDQSFIALAFDNQLWHISPDASDWSAHPLPSSEQMMTATCAPDGSWWAAGSYSTLQSSHDQGQSWDETSLDEDAILTTLQFIDADQAVVTGEYGLVFTSRDGGQSWDPAGSLPDEFYPHTSHFRSLDEGWVGGLNGFIWHTRDGGDSWRRQPTSTEVSIFGFISGEHGLYAVGDNTTVLSLNGSHWQSLPTPEQPLYLRAGQLLPNQQLLVAGGRGLLLNLELPKALAASTD